jgi:hypothetical protein
MGCSSCKKNKNFIGQINANEQVDLEGESIIVVTLLFFAKFLLFLIGVAIGLPIIIPFTIYMLFKVIFFNQGVDVTTGFVKFGRVLFNQREKKYDAEDIGSYEDDELELVDVDDITEEKNG